MRFEVDGDELVPSDGSEPSILIEGDSAELEGFCESIREAIESGEAGGKLLTTEGVDDVVIRRVD